MNLHGQRHLGPRLRDRRRAAEAAAQAAGGHADVPRRSTCASFVLSRLTFLVLEVALLLGFAVLAFGVPVRGSLRVAGRRSACSPRSPSRRSACSSPRGRGRSRACPASMNLVMLPMWIFSGVFFSVTRFPDALQPFIQALPLTAVIDALAGHACSRARASARSCPSWR